MRTLIVLLILPFFYAADLKAQSDSIRHKDSIAPPPPPPPPPPIPPPGTKVPVRDTSGSHEVLVFAEEMPQFPGGEGAFQEYLAKTIHYPDSAKKYGREGTVYVYFEIAKDGSIENVQCKKGVPKAPELCEESVRVISIMPKWDPGMMNGKPVRVSMTVPIRFQLGN